MWAYWCDVWQPLVKAAGGVVVYKAIDARKLHALRAKADAFFAHCGGFEAFIASVLEVIFVVAVVATSAFPVSIFDGL